MVHAINRGNDFSRDVPIDFTTIRLIGREIVSRIERLRRIDALKTSVDRSAINGSPGR